MPRKGIATLGTMAAYALLFAAGVMEALAARQVVEDDWPGWDPSHHHGRELSVRSGNIVNIKSHGLGQYCNVDDVKDLENALTCDQTGPSSADQAFVIIGSDYSTNKIHDGDLIQIRSQRSNELCGFGSQAEGYPVTCGNFIPGQEADFVITHGHSNKIYLAPSVNSGSKCRPKHVKDSEGLHHLVVCDGKHSTGKQSQFSLTHAAYYEPPPPPVDLDPKSVKPIGDDNFAVGMAQRIWQWLREQVTWDGQLLPGGGKPKPKSRPEPEPAPDADTSPFSSGSIITISDPYFEADGLVCDVAATSPWTHDTEFKAAASRQALEPTTAKAVMAAVSKVEKAVSKVDKAMSKVSKAVSKVEKALKKDDVDEYAVLCDHVSKDDPKAFWKVSGYMLLSDVSSGPVKWGDHFDLRNQATHAACEPEDEYPYVVRCENVRSGNSTKFALFKVQEDSTLSPSTGPLDKRLKAAKVEVFLQHVESGRFCGADTTEAHSPLSCVYTKEDPPSLIFKVQKQYPRAHDN